MRRLAHPPRCAPDCRHRPDDDEVIDIVHPGRNVQNAMSDLVPEVCHGRATCRTSCESSAPTDCCAHAEARGAAYDGANRQREAEGEQGRKGAQGCAHSATSSNTNHSANRAEAEGPADAKDNCCQGLRVLFFLNQGVQLGVVDNLGGPTRHRANHASNQKSVCLDVMGKLAPRCPSCLHDFFDRLCKLFKETKELHLPLTIVALYHPCFGKFEQSQV
mmetsp:Transcript_23398/g.55367  ORF Transcript_23398/g.55367 Transcript_23398/m.55367 type:complete len:218 (-) Transcript_23398:11-664(-)